MVRQWGAGCTGPTGWRIFPSSSAKTTRLQRKKLQPKSRVPLHRNHSQGLARLFGIGAQGKTRQQAQLLQAVHVGGTDAPENRLVALGDHQGNLVRCRYGGQSLPYLVEHQARVDQMAKGRVIGAGHQGSFQFDGRLQAHPYHLSSLIVKPFFM